MEWVKVAKQKALEQNNRSLLVKEGRERGYRKNQAPL